MVKPLHDILSDLYLKDENGEVKLHRSMSHAHMKQVS